MTRALLIVRGAALLLLLAATCYAIDRWSFIPLRCTHAASLDTDALDRAPQNSYQARRLAMQIRADLQDCGCLTDVAIPMARGSAAEIMNDPQAAIIEYQRALRLDRRPELYFNLGLAQQETPERAAGLENIVRACAFDPSRLADIPYDELRQSAEQKLRATYGPDWIP